MLDKTACKTASYGFGFVESVVVGLRRVGKNNLAPSKKATLTISLPHLGTNLSKADANACKLVNTTKFDGAALKSAHAPTMRKKASRMPHACK